MSSMTVPTMRTKYTVELRVTEPAPRFGWVYGLYDPFTKELRYIGQTTRSFAMRMRGHISRQCRRKQPRLSAWVNFVVATWGVYPDIRPIEGCENLTQLRERESFHIRNHIARGFNLLNQERLAALRHPA